MHVTIVILVIRSRWNGFAILNLVWKRSSQFLYLNILEYCKQNSSFFNQKVGNFSIFLPKVTRFAILNKNIKIGSLNFLFVIFLKITSQSNKSSDKCHLFENYYFVEIGNHQKNLYLKELTCANVLFSRYLCVSTKKGEQTFSSKTR